MSPSVVGPSTSYCNSPSLSFYQSQSPLDSKHEEEGNCSHNSHSDHLLYFKPLHPAGGVVMHNGVVSRRTTLHRQNTDVAVTDSTMFSVTSSSGVHTTTAPSSATGRPVRAAPTNPDGAAANGNGSSASDKKKRGRFGKKISKRFTSLLKRSSKKKTLSEAQLRKRVRKAAEKSDWDAVRKLIANYEFSDIPEAMPKRGSFQPSEQVALQEEPSAGGVASGGTSRRPSYGSRTGEGRRSFTGKESAAAAAVIKAAMLDESASSDGVENRLDVGENILHDVCRFSPPLDVLEILLIAVRNRRGSAFGTDDQGRTPLHLAAACGSPPYVIDALIRTDPTPASIGDNDRRSPLHLIMRHLVNEGLHPLPQHQKRVKNQAQDKQLVPQEIIDQTIKTVQILKEAMLSYPGKIDFKDEDKSGYSPLDYAISVNLQNEALLQTLIRRKELRRRRSAQKESRLPVRHLPVSQYSFRSAASACNRSLHSNASSFTEDRDIEILEQLEQDEIDARRHRVVKMSKKKKKEQISDALFDVFGIEITQHESNPEPSELVEEKQASPSKQPLKTEEEEQVVEEEPQQEAQKRLYDNDLYNQHLEAYLEDYMDDYEGGDEHLEEFGEDEDGFDIFDDPEEMQDPTLPLSKTPKDTAGAHVSMDGFILPFRDIFIEDDNDCETVVSEVTVPVVPFLG